MPNLFKPYFFLVLNRSFFLPLDFFLDPPFALLPELLIRPFDTLRFMLKLLPGFLPFLLYLPRFFFFLNKRSFFLLLFASFDFALP